MGLSPSNINVVFVIVGLAMLTVAGNLPQLAQADFTAGYTTPGTTNYPDGGMTLLSETPLLTEWSLNAAVMDKQHGYAYFATNTAPGRIIKVAQSEGAASPRRIGALTLSSGEDNIKHGLIDEGNGYAYFTTSTTPGSIVKVALGTGDEYPSRVASMTLDVEDGGIGAAAIDHAAGYIYVGTTTSPARVIKLAVGVGDAAPSRVATLTLDTGENRLSTGVIDTANNMAYFGTQTSPAVLVKVGLGSGDAPPTRIGSAIPVSNAVTIVQSLIDEANGYAYFTTQTPPKFLKVPLDSRLIPPYLTAVTNLDSTDTNLKGGVLDLVGGRAYFGADRSLLVLSLGAGTAPPVRIGKQQVGTSFETGIACTLIDPTQQYLVAGTNTRPGRVFKVSLGAPTELPTRVSGIALDGFAKSLTCSAFDQDRNIAYFGAYTSPGTIKKVCMGNGPEAPTEQGVLFLEEGENLITSIALDVDRQYAYLGTDTSPGKLVKVDVGGEIMRRMGTLTLENDEIGIASFVIDTARGFGYAATKQEPCRLVKFSLGDGANLPSRVTTLNAGAPMTAALIDPANQNAYFVSSSVFSSFQKYGLGEGPNPPEFRGSNYLAGSTTPLSATIDPLRGQAYLGMEFFNTDGHIWQIGLGKGDAIPEVAIRVSLGEERAGSGAIDLSGEKIYFGIYTYLSSGGDPPARVAKYALGDSVPSLMASVPAGSGKFKTSALDSEQGYLYFGMSRTPDRILKFALAQQTQLKATKLNLSESALVTDMRFYSHAASGNVRLSLYDDSEPKRLVWESGQIVNTAQDSELVVPIGEGIPGSLFLAQGTYWAAWQVESSIDVPSYSEGAQGEGFTLRTPFSAAPPDIEGSAVVYTNARWTQYITYTTLSDSWFLY